MPRIRGFGADVKQLRLMENIDYALFRQDGNGGGLRVFWLRNLNSQYHTIDTPRHDATIATT